MRSRYFNIKDIPEADKEPDFWQFIGNEDFKEVALLMILNEIRKYEPETLTAEACRSQLAKIKAFAEMIDIPAFLENRGQENVEHTDELPE